MSPDILQRWVTGLNWFAGIATLLASVSFIVSLRLSGRLERLRAADVEKKEHSMTAQISAAQAQTAEAVGKQEVAEKEATRRIAEVEGHARTAMEEAARLREHGGQRQLSLDQAMAFQAVLKRGPSGRVLVESPIGDNEARVFAEQLNGLLQTSGQPTDVMRQGVFLDFCTGITVMLADPNNTPSNAVATIEALRAAGLDPEGTYSPEIEAGLLILRVGGKPTLKPRP